MRAAELEERRLLGGGEDLVGEGEVEEAIELGQRGGAAAARADIAINAGAGLGVEQLRARA